LIVGEYNTTRNINNVNGVKRALIYVGETLSIDGLFYKKRYLVKLSMENEVTHMAMINEMIQGCYNYNARSSGHVEVSYVTCLQKSECTAESSFHFNVAGTKYYVWLNVAGTDSDPTHAGETAIEADISGSGSATTVAEVIDGLIDAKAGVGCDNNASEILTITNDVNGNVISTYDDTTTPTGFTITINDGGITFPAVMCNIQYAYGGRVFVENNGRYNQDLWFDVEWASS
jgi:hypothetical protein